MGSFNNINYFNLIEYSINPVLQKRTQIGDLEQKQIDKALEIRKEYSLPFWESLILTFFSNEHYSFQLLNNIMFHNENFLVNKLPIQKINDLEKIIEHNIGNKYYAFSSNLEAESGEIFHLPMLDFHCPNNSINLKLVKDVISIISNESGYIIESGDSYHYYGSKLLKESELITFLGKALQYSPIIDKTWIAHQLQEKNCVLRISKKHDKYPFLVSRIIK
jgi:hypothetical protein